jgi:hypothetical protein
MASPYGSGMTKKKIIYGLVALAAFLALAIALLAYNANKIIKHELQQFLGKGFSVEEISLRWGHVEVREIRLLRPDSKEAFSAKDLEVRADFIGLIKKEDVISDITLDTPNLFLEVDKRGKIIFPWPKRGNNGRTDRVQGKSPDKGARPFLIKKFKIKHGSLDYLDRKVSARPALIQLREVRAELHDFSTPPDNRMSDYAIAASIPGRLKKGSLKAEGTLNRSTRDTKSKLAIRDLDITQLRPYFEKKGDVEVTQGLLSLDADIVVEKAKINSSGKIMIRGLAFRTDSGGILGLPQLAVTKLLKDSHEQISLDFTIEGDLNNPRFSITDSLIQQLSLSLAKLLGMPVEAISKSIFDLGGSVLKKLFQ